MASLLRHGVLPSDQFSWAVSLRDGQGKILPRDQPRKRPPPLDSGLGPRPRPVYKAGGRSPPRIPGRASVNMLGLASQARAWRRTEKMAAERHALLKWRMLVRAGRLIVRVLPVATIMHSNALWRKAMLSTAAECLARWRVHAAKIGALSELVQLYTPHAWRGVLARAFARLFNPLVRFRAAATRAMQQGKLLRLHALRRWRAQVTSASLAAHMYALAVAQTAKRSCRLNRLGRGMASWRGWCALDAVAYSAEELCALHCTATAWRRAITRWRYAHEAATMQFDFLALAERIHRARARRRAFLQWQMRMQPLSSGGCRGAKALRRATALATRLAYDKELAKLAGAMGNFRALVERDYALHWATLHASTRGRAIAAKLALRRWCALVAEPQPLGAVTRIARIFSLRASKKAEELAQRSRLSNGGVGDIAARMMCRDGSLDGAWLHTSMADVLRAATPQPLH